MSKIILQNLRITNPDLLNLTAKELSEKFESGRFLTALCSEKGKPHQAIFFVKNIKDSKPILVGEIISTQKELVNVERG